MEHKGAIGWGAIAAFVAVFDVLSDETLSEAFKQARESESLSKRALAIGGLAVTAAHLMDFIPTQYDPFDKVINIAKSILDDF